MRLSDIEPLFVCKACGKRGAEVRPDFCCPHPPPRSRGRWSFRLLSGRSISSYEATWVLSDHDSSAAPQTLQIASPVCGIKNFSSVRLYSAPQLHLTIVAISQICARKRPFSSWNYATIGAVAPNTKHEHAD